MGWGRELGADGVVMDDGELISVEGAWVSIVKFMCLFLLIDDVLLVE